MNALLRSPYPSIWVLFSAALLFTTQLSAQITAIPDSYTFQVGQNITANVLSNDTAPQSVTVIQPELDACFRIFGDGSIQWNPGIDQTDCCGEHTLFYYLTGQGSGQPLTPLTPVVITVECAKPDCNLIDLSSFLSSPGSPTSDQSCVSVCEDSQVTFFVPWNLNNTYQWMVLSGGTGAVGSNPAEYIVNWGAVGSGVLQLIITNPANVSTTIIICVDILPKPIASFTSSGYVCLKQCLQFNNTSTNATGYLWDFGDGNTSEETNPCWLYTNPGLYTVTLTATNQNFGSDGSVLCCCTDVFTMEVEVDELCGPSIYCVSTLCEGDEACYSTDATNCATYVWTILDANGNDITNTITGQGTGNICLTWGIGPVGTISLAVTGCDSTYCTNPSTVQVPIIPAVSTITGPIIVCEFSTEVYSLPKWLGTAYQWTVTGGTLAGSGTGHVEAINWGPAGTGTITVNYGSEFLACIPGHEEGDCEGTATLNVLIRPSFSLVNNGPSTVCLGNSSLITATASPLPTYTWTVTPNLPANTTAGQGTNAFNINWGVAGTYIISAEPTDTISYCNKKKTVVITVVDVPTPLGITGETDICPGDAYFYTALPNGSGYGFAWTAVNGTLSSTTGTTVGVTWAPSGPYSVSVSQVLTSVPFCQSLPFTLTVTPKGPNGPYTIQGGPACLNSLTSYNLVPNSLIPPPHPDINITWSLSDPTKGSIVGGQGSSSVQIQWGNTPGSFQLIASAELCGVVVTTQFNITLTPKPNPVISQVGLLCPLGNSVSLTVNPAFASYSWSPGGGITQTINTSTPGAASVTVTDANGCTATAFHQVGTQPGPVAQIYSDQGNVICIQTPTSITMFGQTNPNYVFTWYCIPPSSAPILVQGPSATPSFTHHQQGAGTYVYYFIVTDTSNPGCSKQSPNYVINEILCEGFDPCDPEGYTLTGSFSPSTPYCDIITFSYVASPSFTFTGWTFGDGGGSASASPTNTYAAVGCYNARVCGTVPTLDPLDDPATTCTVCFDVPVCVPVKARLSVNNPSCGVFNFTNLSTFLPGNGPLTYLWSANDILSQTSTATNPTFTFTPQAPVTVTLTATTPSGCQSQVSIVVIPNSLGIPVITAPASVCMNEAFNFSVNAPSAVTYSWIFGGSGTFGAQAGQFAYASPPTIAGVNPVSVTVTDAIGCVATAGTTIVVHPAVPPAQITAAPDLVICQGATTTLSAPAGYTYLWSPGNQTTQTISVGAGTYSVTITDANGCSRDLDQVEVVELPLPLASISGNLYICDAGCVTLSAPLESGFQYQWCDDLNNVLAGDTAYQLLVCDNNLLTGYSVKITDQNGCTNSAGPVTVQVAISPSFTVSVNPTPACAGQPTTLTITPFDPTLSYIWSTGATTQSITVTQAGTYTVVGTDNTSGCSSSASGTVNPLPDLCIVPEGCYDICPPKTICGPPGLAFYQWNLNGSPISNANDTCLTITASGTYSLTATNQFGCTTTSGDLVLNVIDCPVALCDSVSVDYTYLMNDEGIPDSCCVVVNYTNLLGGIKGLNIYTSDGDLVMAPGSLSPLLNLQSVTNTSVTLTSISPGSDIPTGVLSSFITLCIQNATNSPQVIVIEWLDLEYEVICTDSIILNCPVEPECIYVLDDEIYCEDEGIFYSFTICNPASNAYPIGFIDILPSTPDSIIVVPAFIDLTGNPLLPGNCQTFTVQLLGPGIEGQTFCYKLVGHEQNPFEFPGTLCCSLDSLNYIDIPFCDPCPFVSVEGWVPSEGDGCCFDITLLNNFVPGYFDEIGICVLSPQTTITLNNPLGSGWLTSGYTNTAFSLLPDPIGSGVPTGAFTLPQMCLQTNVPPLQQIEIKWMKDGVVICRDTIEVFCEPPCGYLDEESIICEGNSGFYIYQGILNNNSGQTITEAFIQFNSPAGMGAYNQTINFAPVAPGNSIPISFVIGPPALPGDTVCFTVTLHQLNDMGIPIQCCYFEHCIVLPDCGQNDECLCDQEFFAQVAGGILTAQVTGNTFIFGPFNASYFGACDTFMWTWGDTSPPTYTTGPSDVTHSYTLPGIYKICMWVTRTLPSGEICEARVCTRVKVIGLIDPIDISPNPAAMTVFPNPTEGIFSLKMYDDTVYPVEFIVQDVTGHDVVRYLQLDKPDNNVVKFDLTKEAKGLYVIRFNIGENQVYKKVLKQ